MSGRCSATGSAAWPRAAESADFRINLSLGLTIYCSAPALGGLPPPDPVEGLRTMFDHLRACVSAVAVVAALAVGGCSTTTGEPPTPPARSPPTAAAAHRTRNGGRRWMRWGERYRAKPERSRSRRSATRRPCAPSASARRRPRCSSRRRIHNPEQSGRARRLRPRARRQRQLRAGARRAQPRPHARTSRTGASSRRKARCSIRWAATRRRSATTPAR